MTAPLLNVEIPSIEVAQRNVARLLQQSLQQASQAAGVADLSATDIQLARSNVAALAFVEAVGVHGAYRYVRDFLARQAIPIYSTGSFLDGWLETFKLTRKAASSAQGSASGTGVTGAILGAGTLLRTPTGSLVKLTAAATVIAGSGISISAIAMTPGALAIKAGTELTLVSPVSGVDSTFTVAADWVPGVDAETDEQAIYRLQQRLAYEPMGGAPGDYARWALQVAGITRAWGVRNIAGATSAGVICMADGNPSSVSAYGLPTAAQLSQVVAYITDPMRGPPDELHVIAPTPVLIAPTIQLTPDTPEIRAAATAALRDVFFREVTPGSSLPHGHLIEAISEVAGEYNHRWVSPALNQGDLFTVPTFAHMLVLVDPVFA